MAAHQAAASLGSSRQEHCSGLPFPSPVHESEKWKWSHSVVSYSSWPHGLQPSRLLHPWDFPGKSTGVARHCLLLQVIVNGLSPIQMTNGMGDRGLLTETDPNIAEYLYHWQLSTKCKYHPLVTVTSRNNPIRSLIITTIDSQTVQYMNSKARLSFVLFLTSLVPGGASQVALVVKNLPACQCRKHNETWVWSLGREDPPEEGIATHSLYSCLENPMDRGAWRATVHGSQGVGHNWSDLACTVPGTRGSQCLLK